RNVLRDVTCASSSDCWAVGYYQSASAVQTLVQHWNGSSWAIVNSPNTLVAQSNYLLNVTCASASNCWAVGYYSGASADQTLIEHWDGTAWTITTSPNTLITQSNYLQNVTCASASDCWATGYYFNDITNPPKNQTLIQHWNGTSWTITNSPNTSNI